MKKKNYLVKTPINCHKRNVLQDEGITQYFPGKKTFGCTMKSVLNRTLIKPESCIKETLNKVTMNVGNIVLI